jgi:hypothetical protein
VVQAQLGARDVTHEQAAVLQAIKAVHPGLRRIPSDTPLADELLAECVSDTYAFGCDGCHWVFTVEPDGETEAWALVD